MRFAIIGFCAGAFISSSSFAIADFESKDYHGMRIMGAWALLNLIGLIISLAW
jgi:hypothetical protein